MILPVERNRTRLEIKNVLKPGKPGNNGDDIRQGLMAHPKSIPTKYFYDARGSKLFEEICTLPEYYLTRTELSLLKRSAGAITGSFNGGDLVELGSGANWKIRTLLDALGPETQARTRYVPVDVSSTALEAAAQELLQIYPHLHIVGIIGDLTLDLHHLPTGRPRLIMFLGSTIGNLDEAESISFLKSVSHILQPGDRFLLAMDMVKPVEIIEAAYSDSLGVTAEFNRNILLVVNNEIGTEFDPKDFEHVAVYNRELHQVEMYLRAKRRVIAEIGDSGTEIHIREGELIRTEICRKFTRESAEEMIGKAGLRIVAWHTDTDGWFVHAETVRVEEP